LNEQVKDDEMGRACRTYGEKRNAYRFSVGNPRRRWEDSIKMDDRERGSGGMNWTVPTQDRDQWRALVNTVMSFRVTQNIEKFLSVSTTGGLSRRAEVHGVS
jgi:hypothetical protein